MPLPNLLPATFFRSLSGGKLLTFALVIVLGSLLQLWIVLLIVGVIKGQSVEAGKVLGDGGLLFFTSSLIVGGALQLIKKRELAPGSVDLNVLLVTILFFLLPAVIMYAVVVPNHLIATTPPKNPPFFDLITPQLAVSVGALTFAIFVGMRTGQFKK